MALTQKPQILDALSLFSLKVGPNIFDISSSMQHVSIRDQIVRGQLVIRDLLQADPQTRSILIVGCGAAGASAALAASSAGVDQVLVVDAQLQTFSLLRGVTSRYVGPFMYEWPSSLYKDQSYPSPLATRSYVAAPELSWTSAAPCQADDLARLLEKSFATSIKSLVTDLTVALGVDAGKISNFVKSFNQGKPSRMPLFVPGPYALQTHASRSRYSGHLPVRIQPDYIVLAGGMGKENCWLLGGTTAANDHRGIAFWDNDHLLAANSANLKIAIFGGGDGALQDVLRALTGFDHPLDFIGKLERDPRMKTAISCIKPELLSLDRQSRKLSTWTADNTVFQVIDRKCRLLAEKLATLIGVRKNVLKNIRKGSGAVWLFVREDHFGKAYLLNRFLVHLLAACVNYRGAKTTAGRMELTICFNSTATEYSSLPATGSIGTGHQKHRIGVLDGAGSRNMDFDEVVVRYGIEKGSVPGAQMIQLSKKPSAQRTVLNRIELPFVVE